MTQRRGPQWAFHNIFEAMAGSTTASNTRAIEALSAQSKGDLFSIAQCFDQVNRILDPELPRSPAIQVGNNFSIHAILQYLQDDSYVDLWIRMLKTDADSLSKVDVPILELRNTALDHYIDVNPAIAQSENEILHIAASCVRTKLNVLHGYGEAREGRGYSRRTLPTRYYDRPKQKEMESKHMSEVSEVVNSTLVGVASIFTTLAFIPSILAWSHSDGSIGARSDMDFWLLIQSSTMQLLGIFLAMFSLKGKRMLATGALTWTVLFSIAGSACACASIAMYLTMPSFWSGFVSFCGTVSQIWTVVILCIAAGPSIKTKQS